MKDGFRYPPCYAVDEIYYTFTDASQLKEICAGGSRLTERTPLTKLHAFVVLVTTSYPAMITSVFP